MSVAVAEPPSGNGSWAGDSWERAGARRVCARALVLALDPTVGSSTAAAELAAPDGRDARSVLRALAFVRAAGARPSPVNDRAEQALLLTLAALVPAKAGGHARTLRSKSMTDVSAHLRVLADAYRCAFMDRLASADGIPSAPQTGGAGHSSSTRCTYTTCST